MFWIFLSRFVIWECVSVILIYNLIIPPLPEGGGGYTVLPLSVCPSVRPRYFSLHCWWQESDIWSQASYRCAILWEAFLDPSDSYFLFADLVGFYTHWTYMHIFRHIFLSNYWWQRSDIWSQASYRYPISREAFFDPSDSYFQFAEERGYHKWALAHSSSCCFFLHRIQTVNITTYPVIDLFQTIIQKHKETKPILALLDEVTLIKDFEFLTSEIINHFQGLYIVYGDYTRYNIM